MEDVLGIIMIIIVVIGCCVVLPIMIVWMNNRRKQHEIDKQTEILIAMLEKHPDLDPAEVMKKLNVSSKSHKSVKEKLLNNLFSGGMMLLVFVAGVLTGGILMLITLMHPAWLIPEFSAPTLSTSLTTVFPKVCLLLAVCFISLGTTGLVGSVVLNKRR